MADQEMLTAYETNPAEPARPPRIEYELTDNGEQEYTALLRRALSDRDPSLEVLGAALGLIEDLSRQDALQMLHVRARAMRRWHAGITEHLPPDTDLDSWGPIGELISLWLSTADTGAQWTQRLIRRLENGDFTMADEIPLPD